ncbi:MAG TPA: hypothetical protein PKL41_00605 [Flavobacteriales bacterium]|jgi:hypothetical protein|nr:hypothetical protein [Flavobacteriales bacterium]
MSAVGSWHLEGSKNLTHGNHMKLERVTYERLNSRQKERFNFQKVSALLADYGFATLKLDDDWQGADFIAVHITGEHLKVQLKSRLTFDTKYKCKGIHIVFPNDGNWYLIDHDKMLDEFLKRFADTFAMTASWGKGGYSWNHLSREKLDLLKPFRLQP